MKPKLILCLALVLGGVLVFWLWLFPHFFWSWSINRPWTQISEIAEFHSGEKLVRENHFLSGFPRSVLQDSDLFIQWTNGEKGLLAMTDHYSSVNHYAFSKDGDIYVIGVGGTVYYRLKSSPTNQWNSWTLNGSPKIYNFIKNYLDAHSPGSYAADTNEFAPAGAIEIKCNHLGEEQPLIIVPQGDLPYAYEIGSIRNQGRELVAVPFASNPFAPKKLIFSQDGDSGEWKFNETLTAKAN